MGLVLRGCCSRDPCIFMIFILYIHSIHNKHQEKCACYLQYLESGDIGQGYRNLTNQAVVVKTSILAHRHRTNKFVTLPKYKSTEDTNKNKNVNDFFFQRQHE
jgi:hypothetical protein